MTHQNKKFKPMVTVSEVFSKVQDAPLYQQDKHLKILMLCFQEARSEQEFTTHFKDALLKILYGPLNNPFIKKMVEFVAKFMAMKLQEEEDLNSETISPFLADAFEYILMLCKLDDKNLRFNSCKLLHLTLKEAAEQEISLDDEICTKITQVIISERICDKVVAIREEAAKVLQWLQDETNPGCAVTRTLMFHMSRDVSSEVRKQILSIIRVSSITLPGIVQRIRDVKPNIRENAYRILASRRKMTSLTFATREKIISCGLKDESETVRSTVEDYLLPHWLDQLQGGLLEFIRELDVETHPDVPKMVLPHLFKNKTIQELLVPLQPPADEKFIPMESLDPSLALYWSCLARYLAKEVDEGEKKEEAAEALEKLLPSVVELCNYVGMVFDAPRLVASTGEQQDTFDERRVSTLIFLLELFDSCDLSDESGRKCLNQLLERMLMSSENNQRLLESISRQLSLGYIDPVDRVNKVLSIIDELHRPLVRRVKTEPEPEIMPEHQRREQQVQMAKVRVAICKLQFEQEKAIEKQDFLRAESIKEQLKEKRLELQQMEQELNQCPQGEEEVEMVREELMSTPVLIKCLAIVLQLMREKDVFKASIGLADFVDNFVQKCFSVENPRVMSMAIEINGIYCLQRLPNAKARLLMFYIFLKEEANLCDEVRAMCVKCICAIMVRWGLKALEIPANEPIFAPERTRLNASIRPELSYISHITYLWNDPAVCVRNQATIGLCKLLLSSQLNSVPLLSRLILQWFNPSNASNKSVMNILGQFFYIYPCHQYQAPKLLASALIPSLDLLLQAPHSSPLVDIDGLDIGLFILDLTRPGKNKYYKKNAHDYLAQALLERVLDEAAGDTISLFLRLCTNLEISVENDDVRVPLYKLVRKIKRLHGKYLKSKYLDKLLNMFRGNDEQPSSQDSFIQSQDTQENDSSDGKENSQPIVSLPYGNHDEAALMDLEDSLATLEIPQRHSQRSRTQGHISDTDSD